MELPAPRSVWTQQGWHRADGKWSWEVERRQVRGWDSSGVKSPDLLPRKPPLGWKGGSPRLLGWPLGRCRGSFWPPSLKMDQDHCSLLPSRLLFLSLQKCEVLSERGPLPREQHFALFTLHALFLTFLSPFSVVHAFIYLFG